MKLKNSIKILIVVAVILIAGGIFSHQTLAASFSAKASTSSVNVGDKYTLTITGNNVTGKFTIKGNDNVTITSATSVWIENNSATVSAIAKKTGTGTITVTAADVADSSSGEAVSGSESYSVTIKEKTTPTPPTTTTTTTTTNQKSGNNKLSNLGIRPNDFSGFKPGTTKYNVTVPNDVEEVEVYAKAQDSKSKISGIGKVKLKEGENTIKVTCKAENGSAKTYTINVTRSAETQTNEPTEEQPLHEEQPVNEETSEEKELKLESLLIEGEELLPVFNSDTYEYNVELKQENIEKLNIVAKSNYDEAKINITGNENLHSGENKITIEVKLEESDKTIMYTINVNKPEATNFNDEIEKMKQEAQNRNILLIVISIITIISVTFNVLNIVKKK